ncbi:MAG: HAD family hydrolase [Humidesulfovibrio sp.]|uniref:HAD family hydrolase n=1 Tax=Humidesulfovibrio sp. TaxID=2910988 RepID=UPI0027360AE0|nr:HAD family hydrolase [Humidesulfovibrio sp.]MDP2848584.1 HAD family hydrolase [Humidesulfovibrio sp.]
MQSLTQSPGQPFQALLFDFDGTLSRLTIDFPRLRRKITALAEAFLGEEPEPSEVPVLEWITVIADEIALMDEDLGRQFHTRGRLIIQATELDAARDGELFPATRPLLLRLRQSGVKVGILTRNSTAAVKVVFPDVLACCDVFMAREDTQNVKPHPDHALTLLSRLAVRPERALLVGDHPLDIEAARRAGIFAAAVQSGHASPEALAKAKPDYMAKDCEELLSFLASRSLLPHA